MDVRICPKCRAEYYSHITKCADCGTPLKSLDEIKAGGIEARVEGSVDGWVEIRHDAKGWIDELSELLIEGGVPARVELAEGCRAGSCGAQYRLLVPGIAADDAMQMIEDYFVEMHPEAGQADEWATEGKCPACGHLVDAAMKECPDCGLALKIEEDCDGNPGKGCR